MGDFRSYNHAALTPHPLNDTTFGYATGASTFATFIPWFPEAMNIKEFAGRSDSSVDYVTFRFYTSAANRISETGNVYTFTYAITYADITPLINHTRDTAKRANTMQLVSIPAIPTQNTPLYMDTYISDISGNRLINLGTKSNGYTTLTLLPNVTPYVVGQRTGSPVVPSGYTAIFPNVYETVRCTTGHVNQSLGVIYSFNIVAYGVHSGGNRTIRLSSTDIILTVDGVRTTLQTGLELDKLGKSFTGTLTGGTFNYNDVGYVTFENAVADPTQINMC
jgi:hypothetical protein